MTGLLLLAAGLVFHPVEPCRVVDTRVESIITCHPDNNGICTHTVSGTYGFVVAGDDSREMWKDRGFGHAFTYTFAEQGGKDGGCGVPREAKAVALNIAIHPIHTGSGHLRMWPHGIRDYHPFGDIPIPTKPPVASILNWPGNHCERDESVPSPIACKTWPENWFNNSVHIPICDPETANFGDCNEDVLIRATGVHGLVGVMVVVDVYGYYSVN